MRTLPQAAEIARLREFLDDHEYDTEHLTKRLGAARPPTAADQRRMFDDSREVTAANVLIRLFLLGAAVDRGTVEEFVPGDVLSVCLEHALLEEQGGMITGGIVIVPVEDLLFASDAFSTLGTDRASEFVLPASTHSANFLRFLTLRRPVRSMLDLGCGCGIHALFAARHSDRVTATDISSAALRYTDFNARLNGIDNIECLQGNLFEPVAGRQFDLIVSNPPFVVSPSHAFVYRDNSMELDEFCRVLLGEAPAYLAEDGFLQMLCEWVEVDGQTWEDRVAQSIRRCDAWVLHAPPVTPSAYVERRRADITATSTATGTRNDWLSYLETNSVRAVHPSMLTLRRRDDDNWLHIQNLSRDVSRPAGDAIIAGFAAIDFVDACDDNDLLDAYLTLPASLQAEQIGSDTNSPGVYMKLDNGLSTDAEVDGPVAAFLNLFNGERSVRDCIAEFATVVQADLATLTRDLTSITRVFASRGFLVPVTPE